MSFAADVVFPDDKFTKLLSLGSNKHLINQFGNEGVNSLFATGFHHELKGKPTFTSDDDALLARCDHKDVPQFWFECTSRKDRRLPNGRLTDAVLPLKSMQRRKYLEFFGSCGIMNPMPLLENKTYGRHGIYSKFSTITTRDDDKTVVIERSSLPYIVTDKALFPPKCKPFYMFNEKGERIQFVVSNKPLRIEITFPSTSSVVENVQM